MPFDPAAEVAGLLPWDVIYPFDNLAKPVKHKMWVCVSRADLSFLRINTRRYDGLCVDLIQSQHSFLLRDSFLGCGGDLITVLEAELEYLLSQQKDRARQGIIGEVHQSVRIAVCEAVCRSPRLSPHQVRGIMAELGCQ